MINLIEAEIFKLKKFSGVKIFTLLVWLVALSPILLSVGVIRTNLDGPSGLGAYDFVKVLLNLMIVTIPTFVIFPSTFVFSREFLNNMPARSVEASHGRASILTAKIITEFIYSFFIIATTLLIGFITSQVISIFADAGGVIYKEQDVASCFFGLFLTILVNISTLAFLNLSYIVLNKDFAVIISYVIYYNLSDIIRFIMDNFIFNGGSVVEKILVYLPSSISKEVGANEITNILLGARPLDISYRGILISLMYAVVFTAISYILIKKKDFNWYLFYFFWLFLSFISLLNMLI